MSAFPFVPVVSCTYLNHACRIAWPKWLEGTEVDECLSWVAGRDFMTRFMLVHLCTHTCSCSCKVPRDEKHRKKRTWRLGFFSFLPLSNSVKQWMHCAAGPTRTSTHNATIGLFFSFFQINLLSFLYFFSFPRPCDALSPFPRLLPPPSLLTAACCSPAEARAAIVGTQVSWR